MEAVREAFMPPFSYFEEQKKGGIKCLPHGICVYFSIY